MSTKSMFEEIETELEWRAFKDGDSYTRRLQQEIHAIIKKMKAEYRETGTIKGW